MNSEISVIVPVYNVATYLRRCLDSLLRQTFRALEVICVDDGSSDASAEILSEYAARDARVRVITRKNGGLSAARNTGLEAVSAPYVMFCDSDDWVEPSWCEELHGELLRTGADFVVSRASIDGTVTRRRRRSLEGSHELTRHGVLDSSPDLRPEINPAVWVKIFRRELIERHHLRFAEGLLYEDCLFSMQYLTVSSRVAFLDRKLYHYFQRPDSILNHTVKADARHLLDRERLALLAREFLLKSGLWPLWRAQWFEIFRSAVDNCLCDGGSVPAAVYDMVPREVLGEPREGLPARVARWLEAFAARDLVVPLRIRKGIGGLTLFKVTRTQFKTSVRLLGLPIYHAKRKRRSARCP